MKSKSQQSRRTLLKAVVTTGGVIAAGKTLPEKWVKPVVDSVVVPSHALVSGCGGIFCDLITGTPVEIVIIVTGSLVEAEVNTGDPILEGSGPCNPATGSFGFTVTNNGTTWWVEGTIAPDCSSIAGEICDTPGPCLSPIVTYNATPGQCT